MFTQEQVNELSKNKNVSKCSSKAITYNKDFKLRAVKKYYENGYSPGMIFKEAGFDLSMFKEYKPKACLSQWRKIYNSKGEKGLLKDGRGRTERNKKIEFKNNDEKIKYLETKIKYLNAQNDFLAKLRGLKRE